MSTVNLRVYNPILTGGSSCLSLLGGGLILATYAAIPQVRNVTRRLLVYLTVADLLTAGGNLVATARYAALHRQNVDQVIENCTQSAPSPALEDLCTAQSFVTTFSNLTSFIWTFIIALHLWSNVFLRSRITENIVAHVVFHCVAWILPFCLVYVAYDKGYLGEDYCYGTGVWCGIRSDLAGHVIRTWMYVEDTAWQVTCYVATCFFYIHVKFYIAVVRRNMPLSQLCPNLRDEDRNFVFVWMVIYLLKLWGLVRFFVTSYTPAHVIATNKHIGSLLDFLLLLQSYGASGQAFWNCVIFCFCDETVRTRIKLWLVRRSEPEPEAGPLLGEQSSKIQLARAPDKDNSYKY